MRLNAYIDRLMRMLIIPKQPFSHNKLSNDLSMQQLKAIYFVGQQPNNIQRSLSEHLGISVSDTSFTVDKLVEKGLLQRRRSDQDRRIINLELTKKGRIIHEFMLKNHLTFCKNILQKLTEEEQDIFLHLLEKATS